MPTLTTEDFKSLFQSSFDKERWIVVLKDLFKVTQLQANWERIGCPQNEIEGYHLGFIETEDSYRIGLFYYDVKSGSVEKKRVGLRNLVRSFINPTWGEYDAALVVFNSEKAWRLSLISDIKGEQTDPKRYTFVFGKPELSYRTPISRFEQIQRNGVSMQNLADAFSVEALSEEFFNKYRELYADFVQFVTGTRYEKVSGKWKEVKKCEPNTMFARSFGNDAKCVRDYIKKMMGRITFLHFLQRKGWMNGDLNYMKNLFARSSQRHNYLDMVLEPLFHGILNTKPEERDSVFRAAGWDMSLLSEWKNIPYLNGGLFERDSSDEAEAVFPESYFARLFDFFSQYNFTIDENDPYDAEVGVDPEMLGKIFENLLEDNKDKGAFYTPKNIVQYMCRESLIAYLQQFTSSAERDIRSFVVNPEETTLTPLLKEKMADALFKVKICDPAIGSGAFPMGLLNELMRCHEALVDSAVSRAELKKNIISSNIYGVDIEKGAVDIARLRFWLSIVVDEDVPTPLPNLDFKIMQGNSLLEEYNGLPLTGGSFAEQDEKRARQTNSIEWQDWLVFDEGEALDNIQHGIQAYYNATDHAKKQILRDFIHNHVRSYIKCIIPNAHDEVDAMPMPNDKFFLWHIYFKDVFDKGGFDIVIGNPPYISTKGVSSELKKNYEHAFGFSDDLYNLFFFQGMNLLRQDGILCYITSKTFWTTQTKRNLRDLLLSKNIKFIFDAGNPFEEALVDTCITAVCNTPCRENGLLTFYDGKEMFESPRIYTVYQDVYKNTQNCAIFLPTPQNLDLQRIFGASVRDLHDKWWSKIKTSKDIEDNAEELSAYRASLRPGDITLLGCLTDGGQGLATANNGKYIAVKPNSKLAEKIRITRPQKLAMAILQCGICIDGISLTNNKNELTRNCKNYLSVLDEQETEELFDTLKEQYGRDIFGKGYIYKIAAPALIADVETLSQEEKENGIENGNAFYVPYDKGDKDGNRWYLDTPYVIAWTQDNVRFLKTNSGKHGEGMPVFRNPQFYFKEGFCWNNILNPNARLLKVRVKNASVNDVGGMSLIPVNMSLFYILAYLNSNIIFDYYREFINCTVNVQIGDLRQIPVIIPTMLELKEIERLTSRIINLKKLNQSISKMEAEIDVCITKICTSQ